MAVAGWARARHPRLDQAAVPRRPRPRMGAQTAALPPAAPIRTDQPPRPAAEAASRQRLAVGRTACRRVRAPAKRSQPRPADHSATGAPPLTTIRATPPGVSLPPNPRPGRHRRDHTPPNPARPAVHAPITPPRRLRAPITPRSHPYCNRPDSEPYCKIEVDTSRKPWIVPDAAAADDVVAQVQRCPSGALKFERHRE